MGKLHSRFLLSSISWTFVVPAICTSISLHIVKILVPKTSAIQRFVQSKWSWSLFPAAIVFNEIVFSSLASYTRKGYMDKLGCKLLIPKVRGRWIGNLDVLLAITRNEANDYCGDIFVRWAEEYGPTFDMNILWAHQVVTGESRSMSFKCDFTHLLPVDPSNIKHVIATSFHRFEKGEKFHDMLEGFLGNSIFNSDGDVWKSHRNLARPFFERERMINSCHFEQHTTRLASLLSSLCRTGIQPLDIQDVFSRYTMDFITDFLFGLSSRTMVSPELITKESASLMSAFNELQAAASTRIRITVRPRQTVDAYIMPIVEAALDAKRKTEATQNYDDDAPITLLEYLASCTNDLSLIRDTLVTFLLAGRDTSASLLTFLVYALALYPAVYQRLRAEINESIDTDGVPTVGNIKNMRYLRAVINETLRLFPPVPFNIRRSKDAPTVLPSLLSRVPGGLYMYPRCSITFSTMHVQRRKDIWGDDAEEFRPERWLGEGSTKVHVTNPFAFVPFSGGPRMCLGQNLAYLLVSQTIVSLVQRFTWTLSPEHQRAQVPAEWKDQPGRKGVEQCWPKAALTLHSHKGLFVIMRDDGEADRMIG